MKQATWRIGFVTTVAATMLLAGQVNAETNSAGSSLPAKGKYAQLNKLPDWSGVWNNVSGFDYAELREPDGHLTPGQLPNPAPYNPEYAARMAEQHRLAEAAIAAGGAPAERKGGTCPWPGMPNLNFTPYGFEFLFTPGRVTMLWSAYSMSRRIYTDGRKFPDEVEESYNGLSIGHWEGDTLVVHTKGLRDWTHEQVGMLYSDAMEIDERWHLVQPNRMLLEITMTDPKVFTRPWKSKRYYERMPDWDIGEYACEENKRP